MIWRRNSGRDEVASTISVNITAIRHSSIAKLPPEALKEPMGSVHKFRKPPRNRRQFRAERHSPRSESKPRSRRTWRWGYKQAMLLTLGVSIGGLVGVSALRWMDGNATSSGTFQCSTVDVLDGDTFDCDSTRVRLQGIDAPELEGHCRPGRECAPGDPYASTENLRRLVNWNSVQCRKTDTDAYGRTVARCSAGKTDLSCAQIEGGYAIRRYALIMC